jgi:hypothetical protein
MDYGANERDANERKGTCGCDANEHDVNQRKKGK